MRRWRASTLPFHLFLQPHGMHRYLQRICNGAGNSMETMTTGVWDESTVTLSVEEKTWIIPITLEQPLTLNLSVVSLRLQTGVNQLTAGPLCDWTADEGLRLEQRGDGSVFLPARLLLAQHSSGG